MTTDFNETLFLEFTNIFTLQLRKSFPDGFELFPKSFAKPLTIRLDTEIHVLIFILSYLYFEHATLIFDVLLQKFDVIQIILISMNNQNLQNKK